jgi:Zn-dependent M32 family carboxypeptidase
MSKTNFSKVEKSLEEGMIKMKAQSLLNEADALKGVHENTSTIPSKDVCNTVLTNLEKDLKKMRKENESLYKKFYKFDLKKLINNPSALTPQDWQAVKEIKERVEQYKKELAAKLPHESDQDLIDHERTGHLNKRFNVSNKKWIPLDRIPN